MGNCSCLSTAPPEEYDQLSKGPQSTTSKTKPEPAQSNPNSMKYQQMADDEKTNSYTSIDISANIAIDGLVKIYSENQCDYYFAGLMLNTKQSKLYVVQSKNYRIWKEFEKKTKIDDFLMEFDDENNFKFQQNDALPMIQNMCVIQNHHTNSDEKDEEKVTGINWSSSIDFIIRKNKYEIQRDVLLSQQTDLTLSKLMKINDDYILKQCDSIIIRNYSDNHIDLINDFFKAYGLIIKYQYIDNKQNKMYTIFMSDLLLSDIKKMATKMKEYLINETNLNKETVKSLKIKANCNNYHCSMDDIISVIDLNNFQKSIEVHHDNKVNAVDHDGYLYGFKLTAKNGGDSNDDFCCLLDSNNQRFEWISYLDFVMNGSNKALVATKRFNHVRLGSVSLKDVQIYRECDDTQTCSYIFSLLSLMKIYSEKDDSAMANAIITNNIADTILDSYIHCRTQHNKRFIENFVHGQCSYGVECIYFKRHNMEKNQKTRDYYHKNVNYIDIIRMLDMIHCYIYHNDLKISDDTKDNASNTLNIPNVTTRRRTNSRKFVRNFSHSSAGLHDEDGSVCDDDGDTKTESTKDKKYFGGVLVNYWCHDPDMMFDSDESDSDIDDDMHNDGDAIVVEPVYSCLQEEVTGNCVKGLSNEEYYDIYKRAIKLTKSKYYKAHMKANRDAVLNEKMKIAPGECVTINHIIAMIIYCNYYHICGLWVDYIENDSQNRKCYAEFAHFYRYLCECCQLYGTTMQEEEYLYVVTSTNVLYKRWHEMIYFPISVTPPLTLAQSFIKELQQYHNNKMATPKDEKQLSQQTKQIVLLKLKASADSGNDTDIGGTKYFDVRWLSDSYDEDERFMMMCPVTIHDILLDGNRSTLKYIFAMKLFEKMLNGSFFNCISSLTQIQTQKKLFQLIKSHLLNKNKNKNAQNEGANVKRINCENQYIQDIFDNIVQNKLCLSGEENDNMFEQQKGIWLNKKEFDKIKSDELGDYIYDFDNNKVGTLLEFYKIHANQIHMTQQFEFHIDEDALSEITKKHKNGFVDCDETYEYTLDDGEGKICFYFRLSKKIKIKTSVMSEFYLDICIVSLPKNMDQMQMEAEVFCKDFNVVKEVKPIWLRANESASVMVLSVHNDDENILFSLTFVVSLKKLHEKVVKSAVDILNKL